MADTNEFALSEDPRKQINSMWLLTTQGPTCSREAWAGRARDIGVLDLSLGLEAGPKPEPEAGYSTASRRGSLAERAMRYAFLGSGIGDQVAIQLLPSHTTYIWPSDMA